MSSLHRLLAASLRRGRLSQRNAPLPRLRASNAQRLLCANSSQQQQVQRGQAEQVAQSKSQEDTSSTTTAAKTSNSDNNPAPSADAATPGKEDKPGAIGGFMRGLIGGQSVAVEDAFVAEAKEQGVKIPPPPAQHHASLVPVRRRKRQDSSSSSSSSIRDRLFRRFGGSTFMQGAFEARERIRERIDESDNPVVNALRGLYDRMFAENEMGMVIREIREDDPTFRISEFLRAVEADLIPTILSAYLQADGARLRELCTADALAVLNASIREREAEGIVMDTNILYVGDVELTAARLLEDSPVLIVTFNTQQINCLRDRAGNIVEGKEDDIRAVYYAWAFVREAEFEQHTPSGGGMGSSNKTDTDEGKDGDADADDPDKDNNDEKGAEQQQKPWKLMEMVIRGAHSTI